jgi:hypothetical protein
MIRGTTAEFKFNLPYAKGTLEWATIKFWQPGNLNSYLPITKTLEHCTAEDTSTELCVSLTADETKRFLDKYKARVQIRAKVKEAKEGEVIEGAGTVFASHEEIITVYPMNDDILDDDPMIPSENEDGYIILDGGYIGGE